MKYHTIKSERYNTRCHGAYASYPVYSHGTGERVATLECYAEEVGVYMTRLNKGECALDVAPFMSIK